MCLSFYWHKVPSATLEIHAGRNRQDHHQSFTKNKSFSSVCLSVLLLLSQGLQPLTRSCYVFAKELPRRGCRPAADARFFFIPHKRTADESGQRRRFATALLYMHHTACTSTSRMCGPRPNAATSMTYGCCESINPC